mmetsp:Transcript_79454/g.224717  ORF Transcript_79454/g.224717 Transcript_79454/m.224717 type:complete len:202 (+) Transcript_79454:430-1035(+)
MPAEPNLKRCHVGVLVCAVRVRKVGISAKADRRHNKGPGGNQKGHQQSYGHAWLWDGTEHGSKRKEVTDDVVWQERERDARLEQLKIPGFPAKVAAEPEVADGKGHQLRQRHQKPCRHLVEEEEARRTPEDERGKVPLARHRAGQVPRGHGLVYKQLCKDAVEYPDPEQGGHDQVLHVVPDAGRRGRTLAAEAADEAEQGH